MRRNIKFSANVIHKELHNEACNYLEEFKESLFMDSPVLPPTITETMAYYETLGLTRSKDYKELIKQRDSIWKAQDDRERAREMVLFLLECIKRFGDEVLLIPYNRFVPILKKYNLVTGTLSDYIGDMPLNLVKTIAGIVHKESIPTEGRVWNVAKITGIDVEDLDNFRWYWRNLLKKQVDNLQIFPFIIEGDGKDLFTSGTLTYTNTNSRSIFNKLFPEFSGEGTVRYETLSVTNPLISAPQKDMSYKIKVNSVERPRITIADDPFIYSLTKYGALIYYMWGSESKDPGLTRYKELVKKLSGLVKIAQ